MLQPVIRAPGAQKAASGKIRTANRRDLPISTKMGFVYAYPLPLPTFTELQGSFPVDELPPREASPWPVRTQLFI